jgi:hypothetical protein
MPLTKITDKTGQIGWVVAISVTFFLVIFAFRSYVQAENQVEIAAKARLDAFEIADEFRHSSETMTTMARNFVITGDERYFRLYQQIMAIRDGEQERPQNPAIYWDLLIYGAVKPTGQDKRLASTLGFEPDIAGNNNKIEERSAVTVLCRFFY